MGWQPILRSMRASNLPSTQTHRPISRPKQRKAPGAWVMPEGFVTIGIMTQAPGAFLCFGLLMGLCIWVEGKLDARIERKIGCQPMKDLQEGEDNK